MVLCGLVCHAGGNKKDCFSCFCMKLICMYFSSQSGVPFHLAKFYEMTHQPMLSFVLSSSLAFHSESLKFCQNRRSPSIVVFLSASWEGSSKNKNSISTFSFDTIFEMEKHEKMSFQKGNCEIHLGVSVHSVDSLAKRQTERVQVKLHKRKTPEFCIKTAQIINAWLVE